MHIRRLTQRPIKTTDNRQFTQHEDRQIIEGFNPRKEPAPDGMTSKILILVFKTIPTTVTYIYNECLKRGCFPKKWKTAKIIPITKPGKENSLDPSKYHPISLLNIGDKVLEKLLINRTMQHIYTTDYTNANQFRFTPQKSITNAATVVKQFIQRELERGRVDIMASLDVKGALDVAWWPIILKEVRRQIPPESLPTYVRLL
jgi:hypothetical protein